YPYSLILHLSTLSLFTPLFFFFTATATTEIYTLSLHDALPISVGLRAHLQDLEGHLARPDHAVQRTGRRAARPPAAIGPAHPERSEEHTSELQSPCNLVCRLLLEKKKKKKTKPK